MRDCHKDSNWKKCDSKKIQISKWVELGEKYSKYFCHLESRNILNKTIKKIVNTRGETIYNQSEIMNDAKILYEN